jgi:WD40 repeat protein
VEGATQIEEIDDAEVCVAYSPDGRLLAFARNHNDSVRLVLLWDIEANTVVHTAEIGRKTRYVAFSPDGGFLVLAGTDGKIRIWDSERGRGHTELFGGAAAFVADGSFLCVSEVSDVVIYDVGWEEVDEIE